MISNRVMVSTIVKVVSSLANVPVEDIKSQRRNKYLCELRSIIVSIAREYHDDLAIEGCDSLMRRRYSYPQIAKAIGRRDHTTVINALSVYSSYANANPNIIKLREKALSICNNIAFENTATFEDHEIKLLIKEKQKEALEFQMGKKFENEKRAADRERINKNPVLTKEQREEIKLSIKQEQYEKAIFSFNLTKNKFMPKKIKDADESHLALLSIAEGSRRLLAAILNEGRTHAVAA